MVVATASLANQFAQTAELPLQQVRGQVSELTLPAGTKVPTKVVCAGGYVSPPMDNVLTFGASFVPNNATTQVVEEEHQRNIAELRQALPEHRGSHLQKLSLQLLERLMLLLRQALPEHRKFHLHKLSP